MTYACVYIADIDECKTNYTCPEASNCNNTYGSYECMCWAGYHQVQDSDGFYCLGMWQMHEVKTTFYLKHLLTSIRDSYIHRAKNNFLHTFIQQNISVVVT